MVTGIGAIGKLSGRSSPEKDRLCFLETCTITLISVDSQSQT